METRVLLTEYRTRGSTALASTKILVRGHVVAIAHDEARGLVTPATRYARVLANLVSRRNASCLFGLMGYP